MTPPHLRLLPLSCLIFLCGMAGLQADNLLPVQPQPAFDAALRDTSTSPQFVAVTVVNDESGETISGCIAASLLLGAIHREYDLD